MIKIDGTTLKFYIHSSKSCNTTVQGCVLKPKDSRVHLSFENIKVKSCLLRLKRLPGSDGIVVINDVPHTLPPNVITDIEVKTSSIIIKRAKRPLGSILLAGVLIDDGAEPKVVNMSCDWNSFLKKSGEVKGIKLTDKGLFASEYAEIKKPPPIRKIETDPPNVSRTNKDGDIKFLYSCRIINVEFDDDPAPPMNDSAFSQDVVSKMGHKAQYNFNTEDDGPVVDAKDHKDIAKDASTCIFTLNNLRENTLNKSDYVKQAGTAVKLGRFGTFEVPVSNLQPYRSYVVSLMVAKANGNGKLCVDIGTTEGTVRESKMIFVPQMETEMFVTLETGRHPEFNALYSITVRRPKESATGDIIVRSIRVFDTNTTVQPIKQMGISIAAPAPATSLQSFEKFDVRENWYDYKSANLDINIMEMSKYYSVLTSEKYVPKNTINVGAVARLTDYNSRVWYNRMSPGFIGLEYSYHTMAYHDKQRTSKNDNIAICSIDFLAPSPRVFLDSIPNYREMSKEEIATLSRTKTILTPSLTDLYRIRKQIPQNKVEVCALPWVFVDGKYTRKSYSVYYEENVRLTTQLLNAWTPDFGELYIIGSNLELPAWAKHVSPLTPYQDLLKIILEARRLVYLSCNFHHKSGLIDLVMSAGMPLISNNHHYITNCAPIRNDMEAGMPLPADIHRAVKMDTNKSEFVINAAEYNSKVVAAMKKIIGVA